MSLTCGGQTGLAPSKKVWSSQVVNQGSLEWAIESSGVKCRVFKDVAAVMIQRHTLSRQESLLFGKLWIPLAV